jgi:hypothetical protein
MNNFRTILLVFSFILYLLVQVMVVKQMVLGNAAFSFIYLGFLLLLPLERDSLYLMLMGFVMGICIDIFYDSLGIHAASSVLVMYLRKVWAGSITPQGGYDAGSIPTVFMDGLSWWALYMLPLIFVHHFALFYLETWGFQLFFFTLKKVVLSTIYTFVMLLIIQYVFYRKGR